jgi:predicted NUDIX family NTP pyrophosphohydrolase
LRQSAGLLVYRRRHRGELEVLIVHPGGPYFQRKDHGVWSIPKGEYGPSEEAAAAAGREFAEELGLTAPQGEWLDLGVVRQAGGKLVRAFAVEGDFGVSHVTSNLFEMEWPPGSGRVDRFPEVDRAGWFTPAEAAQRLNRAQVELLDRLASSLEDMGPSSADG